MMGAAPLYRGLTRGIFRVWANARRGAVRRLQASDFPQSVDVWFHAASQGELESLLPLIQGAKAQGRRVAVSIFSQSAARGLANLQKETPGLVAGFSPSEGAWRAVLQAARPGCWVTAKYEAWPDAWASCAQLEIPVLVVGALPRPAFETAALLCRALVGKLPQITVVPFLEADVAAFQQAGWASQVILGADPRWDRVRARAARTHARAEFLWALVRGRSSGPHGVLAQVWPEDLAVWPGAWAQLPGSLVVFPHTLRDDVLNALEAKLREGGFRVRRTAGMQDMPEDVPHGLREAWLVNEIGFLTEFYSKADWVYVGGGFGAGVHSTLEPAVYGLPVACGPARAEKFPEIAWLAQAGQLTVVRSSAELSAWLAGRPWKSARREEWKSRLPRAGEPTQQLLGLIFR